MNAGGDSMRDLRRLGAAEIDGPSLAVLICINKKNFREVRTRNIL